MRICVNALLVEPGKTGGGETFLVNLLKHLFRIDSENDYLVLATATNRHLFETNQKNVEISEVLKGNTSRARRIWYETVQLPLLLKHEKIDLFYSPFGTLPLWLPCKSVVTFQNLLYFDFQNNVPYRGSSLKSRVFVNLQALYYKMMTPRTIARATRIWAISNTTAWQLKKHFRVKETALEVIYAGVEYDRFNPYRSGTKQEPAFEKPYILCVAQLYPNKNLDRVLHAFREAIDRGLRHDLVIVGNDWHGYRRRLELLAEELQISGRVVFTGGVSHDELPPYFWNADLFLLVSNVESFGLPVLEAMSAGVPVIISNRSALPEIAGGAALLASVDQKNHLTEQILRVLKDENLATGLRKLGDQRARSFSWTETAARALDLFYDAAGFSPHKQIHRKDAKSVRNRLTKQEQQAVR